MSDAADRRRDAYARFAAKHPEWFRNEFGGITVAVDAAEMARIEMEMSERYAARGWPSDWAEVGHHYEDPHVMLVRDAVVFPDGSPGIHHRLLRRGRDPSGVAALPVLEGRIALVRHFRHATRSWHWEAPRGAIEAGESLESAVTREIHEEMEGDVARVTTFGRLHGSTAMLGMSVALALAEIRSFGRAQAGEGIASVQLFSVEEMKAMIRAGEITDAFTLGCLLHAELAGAL